MPRPSALRWPIGAHQTGSDLIPAKKWGENRFLRAILIKRHPPHLSKKCGKANRNVSFNFDVFDWLLLLLYFFLKIKIHWWSWSVLLSRCCHSFLSVSLFCWGLILVCFLWLVISVLILCFSNEILMCNFGLFSVTGDISFIIIFFMSSWLPLMFHLFHLYTCMTFKRTC